MPASIFAFDGVLAATIPLRAQSLVLAVEAEGHVVDTARVESVIPGRSMLEAAQLLLPTAASDPTLAELVAMRAQRSYRALVAHGVSFDRESLGLLHAAVGRGDRIVVRADSERRDVEPLLALAGLEHVVHLLRASDDPPRGVVPSLERSWQAIDQRLESLAITVSERTAWEAHAATAAVAKTVVSQVTFPAGSI